MTDDITESNESQVAVLVRPVLTPSHRDGGAKWYPERRLLRPAALQPAANLITNEISAATRG